MAVVKTQSRVYRPFDENQKRKSWKYHLLPVGCLDIVNGQDAVRTVCGINLMCHTLAHEEIESVKATDLCNKCFNGMIVEA